MRRYLIPVAIIFTLVVSMLGVSSGYIVRMEKGDFEYELRLSPQALSDNSIPFEVKEGYSLVDFSFGVRTRGDMSFTRSSVYIDSPECAWGVELNGDGLPEIVVSTQGQNYLFENLGNGDFDVVMEFGYGYCQGMTIEDLDGDGDIDLTFPGQDSETTIWENLGNLEFKRYGLGDTDVSTTSCVWADVDLDGDLDLMTANSAFWDYTDFQDDLFINLGDYQFERYDGLSSEHTLSVDAALIDLDEYPDFFTVGDGEIKFYLNDGTGLSYSELVVDEDAQSYDQDMMVVSTHVMDLDDDGDNDITITRDDVILIFENIDGEFLVNTEMELPPYFCMWDMDLDEKYDVIDFHEGLSVVSDFHGEKNEVMVDDTVMWYGSGSVQDLDGDTDIDIVAEGHNRVYLYSNMIFETQLFNVTKEMSTMIGGNTFEEVFFDIFFEGREVLEIFDVSIKFEKVPVVEEDPQPVDPDHDLDGYTDQEEIEAGSDPYDPFDDPRMHTHEDEQPEVVLEWGPESDDPEIRDPLGISMLREYGIGHEPAFVMGVFLLILGAIAVITAVSLTCYFILKEKRA